MTLEEAIERLNQIYLETAWPSPAEKGKAIQLGIEALKRIDDQRNGKVVPFEQWLPGETEE